MFCGEADRLNGQMCLIVIEHGLSNPGAGAWARNCESIEKNPAQ